MGNIIIPHSPIDSNYFYEDFYDFSDVLDADDLDCITEILDEHVNILTGRKAFVQVFRDNINLLAKHNPRPAVIAEIRKMINFRNPENGTYYICPHCHFQKYAPFTCKSRFCPSCGNLFGMQKSNTICEHLLNVPHRMWTFTIPEDLRSVFEDRWDLIPILFSSAEETIRAAFKRICPNADIEPGFIGILHTFGRDEKFNPHVHFIVTEGGITNRGKWFPTSFYKYEPLKIDYQDRLLKKLIGKLDHNFRKIAAEQKKKYPDGYVVNLPKPEEKLQSDPKKIVKYIARYIARPCIACSRILSYDGKRIKYRFVPHDSKEPMELEMTGIEFVETVSKHIPDSGFNVVRYYGLYNRSNKNSSARLEKALHKDKTLSYLYSSEKKYYRAFFCHWRGAMIYRFKVDPLICPECNNELIPLYSKYLGRVYYAPDTIPRYQTIPSSNRKS